MPSPTDIANQGRALDPKTGTATATGNTAILTPASGKKLRVYGWMLGNGGTADITAYLHFDTSNKEWGKALYAKNGGLGALSLVQGYIEGAVDEAVTINLSANGTVNWTLLYIEIIPPA